MREGELRIPRLQQRRASDHGQLLLGSTRVQCPYPRREFYEHKAMSRWPQIVPGGQVHLRQRYVADWPGELHKLDNSKPNIFVNIYKIDEPQCDFHVGLLYERKRGLQYLLCRVQFACFIHLGIFWYRIGLHIVNLVRSIISPVLCSFLV